MFGEFEDAKHSQNADEGEGSAALGGLAVSLRVLDDKDDEVRHDGQHVDDVHHRTTEVQLRRTGREPHQKLTRKPSHARLMRSQQQHHICLYWMKFVKGR